MSFAVRQALCSSGAGFEANVQPAGPPANHSQGNHDLLALSGSGFNLVLLHDPLYHLNFALDAIQRNSACCRWQETKNPELTAREVEGSSSSLNRLTDFEPMFYHDTPPKELEDKGTISQPHPL